MVNVTIEPDRVLIGQEFVPRFLFLPHVLIVAAGAPIEAPLDSTWDYIEIQQGASLKISRTHDTILRFTHLVILPGGWFDCGDDTTGDIIPANVLVDLLVRDVPIDETRDPFPWGNGIVNFGKQTRCGAG